MVKIKIPEIEWLRENKHLLNQDELSELEELKEFEQHYNGSKLGIVRYLTLLSVLQYLYEKYSNKKMGGDYN